MEVQKLNHKILIAVGMCQSTDASQLRRIFNLILNAFVPVFVLVCGTAPSAAYMYTHMDNLQIFLNSAYQVIAFTSLAGVYSSFAMKKTFVHNVYVTCGRIAIQRIRWATDSRYQRAERKCFLGSIIPFCFITTSFLGNCVVASVHDMITAHLSGRLEPSQWYTPYRMK